MSRSTFLHDDRARYQVAINAPPLRQAVATGNSDAVATMVAYLINVEMDGKKTPMIDEIASVSEYRNLTTVEIGHVSRLALSVAVFFFHQFHSNACQSKRLQRNTGNNRLPMFHSDAFP